MLFASEPVKPNILGVPGLEEKSSISLFKKKPNSSQYNLEPYASFIVVVAEMAA